MITHSGVHIQKVGGAEGTPTPTDIAVHAGRICRFGGAVWYPLLPHLVFVGLMAWRRSHKIENLVWGFLHDAHEAVTSDVPRPFKCDCMRTEQAAIDNRILLEWFTSNFISNIDWDLIHACDIDACDIEAVQLRLPGYAEVTKSHGVQYDAMRPDLYADANDVWLFNAIQHSSFFYDTHLSDSHAVQTFANALRYAKIGNWDAVKEKVRNWRLLDKGEI